MGTSAGVDAAVVVVQRALAGYVPFALPVASTARAQVRWRFRTGGSLVGVRHGNLLADSLVRPVAARQLPDPRDLLVHCAREMNHLAGFLPELHARFG